MLGLNCTICGMPWPHVDANLIASCSHATLVSQWRDDGFMDVTEPIFGVDPVEMLRAAGVELRSLPGRPDRFWGPAWAYQIIGMGRVSGFGPAKRLEVLKAINADEALRQAAEAVGAAGEFVVVVLGEAIIAAIAAQAVSS